jgi:integrase
MWNAEVPKDRRVPHDKVGAVWNYLQAQRAAGNQTKNSRTCADYVAFLMLTAARPGEAQQLTWANVNLEEGAGWWHIEDPKNRKPITRPLSEAAREILAARFKMRDENDPYVFPARSGGGHLKQARTTFKTISKIAGLTLSDHDMRRTFADAAEEAGFEHKTKQLLGHLAADVTGRHYANNRDPRKLVPAVNAIAAHLSEQGTMASGKNVIALRA